MLINRKLGAYVLLRRLAVGGQSEVFLAMKEGPGTFSRPVVIKALPTRYRHDPKFVELFQREAFLSARFSHPHVVTVHDANIIGGEHCMIMDFISGQTVADIAQRGYKAGRPLSLEQGVQIVADACDGLHYAHHFRDLDNREYPVVHRDVSPQNLMVTYQGVTLVFDFGIAKVVGEDAHTDTLAGGKYAYMSPEQCAGDEVDTRSDIFSLGTILYELTVGTRLFRRKNVEDVIDAVCEDPIKAPTEAKSGYPPMLEDIVMKALARDPDGRYQTAGKMRDDLQDFLALKAGTSSRQELGQYVASLFEAEREAIARIIREGEELQSKPKPVGNVPLEELGPEDVDGESSDPAVPMPEPESDESLAEELAENSDVMVLGEEFSEGEREASPAADASAELEREEAGPVQGEPAQPPSGFHEKAAAEEIEAALEEESEPSLEPDDIGDAGEEDDAERWETEERITKLRRRQAVLWVVVGLLALLSIGLGVFAFMNGSAGSDEPVEIGVSE